MEFSRVRGALDLYSFAENGLTRGSLLSGLGSFKMN